MSGMRILAGTLYTIENEFDDCVASIERQTYRNFEHLVIEGLPNKEAHETLYGTFIARRDEFDLLIKVDADMVLLSEHLFEKIVRRFEEDSELALLSIQVYDFFSEQGIGGLNSYRNSANLALAGDRLFTDRVSVRQGKAVWDPEDLAPAAIHCPNPSAFQAFHFGIHTAVKVMQLDRHDADKRYHVMRGHWENLRRTCQGFRNSGDARRGFAVLGAELAFAGTFRKEHLDYTNPFAKEVFGRYGPLDQAGIKREITKLRLRNGGWLPSRLRRAWIWYRSKRQPWSRQAIHELVKEAVFGEL